MESTESKIGKLKSVFSEIQDESVLLEILTSCDGSLKLAEQILLEQFGDELRERKKKQIDEISSRKYQSSILNFYRDGSGKRKRDLGKQNSAVKLNKPNTKTVVLHTKEDIEATLPSVTYHRNFLPQEVANNILKYLMANKHKMQPKDFYIHGKPCHSNHGTGVFSSSESFVNGEQELLYNAKMGKIDQYTDDMKIMQMLVEDKVISLMDERERLSSFQPRSWNGNFSICNMFETKDNNLDWHSDRMLYTGPLPVIASLSLGATREFKLRRNHPVKLNPHPIYSIPLPHNTLIIMHSGTQEEYKHCVSRSVDLIETHPISNQMRFNMTLRSYIPKFYNDPPRCKCDLGMILRRSYKDVSSRGKYIWQCNNVYQNKDCGQIYWAKFDSDTLTTDNEKLCSVWIADDDHEKFKYMEENGIKYDKEKGILIAKGK